jgi:hypothetical protein
MTCCRLNTSGEGMSMFRRLAVLVAALALVAGCGGSSSSDAEAPATKPAPQAYTLKQLESAMPAVEDIPGATEISLRCPQDKKGCEPYGKDTAVITGSVEAASPVGAEQVQNQATPKDFVAVHGGLHANAAAAIKAVEATRKANVPYVGAYDLPERKSGGGTVAAVRGKGALDKMSIDAWSGMAADRTEVASHAKSDQGLLIGMIHLANGRTSVTVFVSLSAAGRESGAAVDLADSLMRSYLQQLG